MARGASIFTLVVALLSVIHYYAAGVLCNNYKLVYPKFYSTGNRFKRSADDGSSLPDYINKDSNIEVEINEWILQYEKSDHFVFGDNFTVEYLNGISETRDFLNIPECEFYYGHVKGLQSMSVVTVCEQEITGFIKSGLLFLIVALIHFLLICGGSGKYTLYLYNLQPLKSHISYNIC